MLATVRDLLSDLDAGDWVALGVGFLGFLTGVGALASARRSNALAEDANKIARDAERHSGRAVELAEKEAEERKRQAEARAVMSAELRPPLQFGSDGSGGTIRPALVVSNTGTQDSGRTTVRLYMPTGTSGDLLAWDGEQTRPDRTRPIAATEEERLHGPTGDPLPTQYLEKTIPNVTTTMPEEFRVAVPVSFPPPGHTGIRIPIRITVRAENADEVAKWVDYIQTYHEP